MKLYEFFGSFQTHDHRDANKDGQVTKEEKEKFKQDLFWYILDNDDLHKKQFYEVTENIYADKECGENIWLPMVNRGCLEYYRSNQLKDDPKDLFTKEFREDICKMLDDHYRKDILDGIYRPGK